MQKRVFTFLLLSLLSFFKMNAQDSYDTRARNYVAQYKDLAIEEQHRTGIPAAITLAQGIHETSGGQSELADNANNHFGIKCKKEWTGKTYSYTDDRPNECFRKYDKVMDSYRDHSDYLSTSPRYAPLFKLAITDYQGWAKGLKNLGYATNPKYALILIKLVEDYGLQDITLAALKSLKKQNKTQEQKVFAAAYSPQNSTANSGEQNKKVTTTNTTSNKKSMSVSYDQVVNDPVYHYEPTTPEPEKPVAAEPLKDGSETVINGMRAFYAKKGAMLLRDAVRYNLRYAKLLEFNDLPDAPLTADMFVYLERKKATGLNETHIVNKGESLFMISQKEGIQLRALRALNKIEANEEPVVGATLQLITMSLTKPSVIAKQIVASTPKISLVDSSKSDPGFISKKDLEKPKESPISKSSTSKETLVVNKPTPTITATKETQAVLKKEEGKKPEVVVIKNTPVIEVPVEEKKIETITPAAEPQQVVSKLIERKQEKPKSNDPSLSAYIRQAMEEAGNDSKDEYALLKEKLDKLVYVNGNPIDEEETTDATVDNQSQQVPVNAEFYTVQKGETAFSIAKKFNLTMQQLQALNKLGFNEITTGQKLRIK